MVYIKFALWESDTENYLWMPLLKRIKYLAEPISCSKDRPQYSYALDRQPRGSFDEMVMSLVVMSFLSLIITISLPTGRGGLGGIPLNTKRRYKSVLMDSAHQSKTPMRRFHWSEINGLTFSL